MGFEMYNIGQYKDVLILKFVIQIKIHLEQMRNLKKKYLDNFTRKTHLADSNTDRYLRQRLTNCIIQMSSFNLIVYKIYFLFVI